MSWDYWQHWGGKREEPAAKAIGKMNKAELVALAGELGVEVSGDETKAELQGAIADAE